MTFILNNYGFFFPLGLQEEIKPIRNVKYVGQYKSLSFFFFKYIIVILNNC